MSTSRQHEGAGSYLPADHGQTLLLLAEQIAPRLRRACAGMDSRLFAQLVTDIARRKLRWAERYGDPLPELPAQPCDPLHGPYDRCPW